MENLRGWMLFGLNNIHITSMPAVTRSNSETHVGPTLLLVRQSALSPVLFKVMLGPRHKADLHQTRFGAQ
jgi:hypothetical protein